MRLVKGTGNNMVSGGHDLFWGTILVLCLTDVPGRHIMSQVSQSISNIWVKVKVSHNRLRWPKGFRVG